MINDQNDKKQEQPEGMGFSFPLGVPMVVYPLLLWGAISWRAMWWGKAFLAVYVVLLALFSYEALSKKEFNDTRKNDPTLNRPTWILNWLLFFVILPLIVLVLFMLRFWRDF